MLETYYALRNRSWTRRAAQSHAGLKEHPVIVITTPTGSIGRRTLEHVLESGEPVRVIARDASRLPENTRDRVEVVKGSHGDRDVVDQAFAGADAVFWLVPPNPRATSAEAAYADFTRPAAHALKRHGVKRVVGISALGRGSACAAHAGLVTASLAMPSFMDNLLRQVESIKNQGVFSLPIRGDQKLPSVATRDIAATAARLLLDALWSGVEIVPVLGPEELSYEDIARVMSDVLG